MLGHLVFKSYEVLLLFVMAGAHFKGVGRGHYSLTLIHTKDSLMKYGVFQFLSLNKK